MRSLRYNAVEKTKLYQSTKSLLSLRIQIVTRWSDTEWWHQRYHLWVDFQRAHVGFFGVWQFLYGMLVLLSCQNVFLATCKHYEHSCWRQTCPHVFIYSIYSISVTFQCFLCSVLFCPPTCMSPPLFILILKIQLGENKTQNQGIIIILSSTEIFSFPCPRCFCIKEGGIGKHAKCLFTLHAFHHQ